MFVELIWNAPNERVDVSIDGEMGEGGVRFDQMEGGVRFFACGSIVSSHDRETLK